MPRVIQNVMAAVLVACAIVVTSLVVRRELRGDASFFRPRGLQDYSPRPVADWAGMVEAGRRRGPPDAPFTVLVFADFQCPACRKFYLSALAPLMTEHPTQVQAIFRHWPLPYHPHARASAIAAECAGRQGGFAEMHDALFEDQDSIGVRTYHDFAEQVGIDDLAEFDACVADALPDSEIEADVGAALLVGARGTPAVIINGQLLEFVPDSAGLLAMFKSAAKS